MGRIQIPALDELSGLAASRRTPGTMWAHNDSGGDAVVYCMTRAGAACGTAAIPGTTPVDWEDIAIGPGRRGDALYIADIGDNDRIRDNVAVHRIDEPQRGADTVADQVQSFDMTYPGPRHDAEAVVVDPATGDLYIVTKKLSGRARVFLARAPLAPGIVLEPVTMLSLAGPFATVTGASVTPDGDRIVLSTYGDGYEFRRVANEPFESIWNHEPTRVDIGSHAQLEAITYTRSGNIVTASEGAGSPILLTRSF